MDTYDSLRLEGNASKGEPRVRRLRGSESDVSSLFTGPSSDPICQVGSSTVMGEGVASATLPEGEARAAEEVGEGGMFLVTNPGGTVTWTVRDDSTSKGKRKKKIRDVVAKQKGQEESAILERWKKARNREVEEMWERAKEEEKGEETRD